MNLDSNEMPHIIVGAAMEVHRTLGQGLMAQAYKACLAQELKMKEMIFKQDEQVQVSYKGQWVECGFTMDLVVESMVVVTVLAEDDFRPIDKEQMKNFLKLTGYETGLLINFNVADLRKGIKRIIVSDAEPKVRYK